MDVTTGLETTPLGAFPADWDYRDVGSLDPFVTSGSRGWAKRYTEFGAAFIRITNMSREAIDLDLSDLKQVRVLANDAEANRTQLRVGDVLVSITADIGIVSWVGDGVPSPAYINQHVSLIRFLRPGVNTRYVAYFLAAEASQRAFRAQTDQGAKAGMNLEEVRRVRLVLPSEAEQAAIATALSDVDALLTKLDQLIAKKRDLKQVAMQQLLTGRTRLPGFNDPWREQAIGELAEIVSGATPRTGVREYWDGRIPWCTPTDITASTAKFLKETDRTLTAAGLAACSARLLPAGALLLCTRATVGEVKIAAMPVCTNQGFKSLVCRGDLHNEYLYYQLLTMKPRMLAKASGSTFPELSRAETAALQLPVPSLGEQRAIAQVLADIDDELVALEARRDKTRQLKQGMMQALLTGQIRLV